MKKFLMLTHGFEKPTPEVMEAWGKWFGSIGQNMVDGGQLPAGREINKSGTKDLPFGPHALTGYMIIQAESLDAAMAVAQACPIIDNIQVFEIAQKK